MTDGVAPLAHARSPARARPYTTLTSTVARRDALIPRVALELQSAPHFSSCALQHERCSDGLGLVGFWLCCMNDVRG